MRTRFLLLLAALGLVLSPQRAFTQTTINTRPPWLMGVRAQAIETVPLRDIRQWGRTLAFDFTPWNAPDGPLLYMGPTGPVVGPRVRVAGRLGAWEGTRERLAEGAVVGRIDSEASVPAAGIAQGVNYIWVEETESGRWRALSIPEAPLPPALPGFRPWGDNPNHWMYELEVTVYEGDACDPGTPPVGAFNSGVAKCFVRDCVIICTGGPVRRLEGAGPLGDPLPDFRLPLLDPLRGLLGPLRPDRGGGMPPR